MSSFVYTAFIISGQRVHQGTVVNHKHEEITSNNTKRNLHHINYIEITLYVSLPCNIAKLAVQTIPTPINEESFRWRKVQMCQ